MQYKYSTGDNREIWDYHTNNGPVNFAVKAVIGGVTYWDNNGGSDYVLENQGVTLYNDIAIHQYYGSANSTYMTVSVNLQNLDYTKSVNVIYTTDGWATTSVKPLHWSSYQMYGYGSAQSPNASGVEYWSTSFSLPAGTTPVEYVFSYDVNGTTYWDNNFGANYISAR
jgi:hypothetical protein